MNDQPVSTGRSDRALGIGAALLAVAVGTPVVAGVGTSEEAMGPFFWLSAAIAIAGGLTALWGRSRWKYAFLPAGSLLSAVMAVLAYVFSVEW